MGFFFCLDSPINAINTNPPSNFCHIVVRFFPRRGAITWLTRCPMCNGDELHSCFHVIIGSRAGCSAEAWVYTTPTVIGHRAKQHAVDFKEFHIFVLRLKSSLVTLLNKISSKTIQLGPYLLLLIFHPDVMVVQCVVSLPPGFDPERGLLDSLLSFAGSPHVHIGFLHVPSVRSSATSQEPGESWC